MAVKIMGILNVTPDSFYDGGRFADRDAALARAVAMWREGADIIDVGGESTRPGAAPVEESVEIDRVCPVIEAAARETGAQISVDTTKAGVARAALAAGATIVNDISGLGFDGAMASVIAGAGAGAVIGHIRGTPGTMQDDPRYDDLLGEITDFLRAAVARAVETGVDRDRIAVDPGIGFGKTVEDNYRIIAGLRRLKELGLPVCVGLSRKSLIGKVLPAGEDRLPATVALNAASVLNGADIIRVHDVKEHGLALRCLEMLMNLSRDNG